MSIEGSDLLPHATAKSLRVIGKIRERPEDFQVVEIPAYPPEGHGDHLFVRFEKTGLNTPDAVRKLAQALGTDPAQASWAGLKDRHAVTTQWASLFGADPERAAAVELPGIRVIEAQRHTHKLRTGHLRGNRFVIRVRCEPGSLQHASTVMRLLAEHGAPNFYGEQRFGRAAGNLHRARRWLLEGGKAPRDRFERKLLVSTLQSEAFNRWLAERMQRIGLGQAIEGDVMRKEDSHGLFVANDLQDATTRMSAWEISPTGPIFGPKMRTPEGPARVIEEGVLESFRIPETVAANVRRIAEGTRRVSRIRPSDVSVTEFEHGIELSFTLPKGAYATIVLRELLKEDPSDREPVEPEPL
jgi:tRNA pseudouridine13 synthase